MKIKEEWKVFCRFQISSCYFAYERSLSHILIGIILMENNKRGKFYAALTCDEIKA